MGILWGVRVPDTITLRDDSDNSGVLDRWDYECTDLIAAHDAETAAWVQAKPGRMPWRRTSGVRRYVPDWPSDVHMAGFWIAVGASGEGGLPTLGGWQSPGYIPVAMSPSGVREVFPKAYRNARARWRRFREWANAHREIAGCDHFATTAPSLWLLPTEVA
jgi:hypothetical protein